MSPEQSFIDTIKFFAEWVRSPKQTAAPVPSSAGLASAMVEQITASLKEDEYVIELGPGTGVFTRMLIKKGIKPENIIAIDLNDEFLSMLKKDSTLTGVKFVKGDATDLTRLFKENSKEGSRLGAVISGLPMLILPEETQVNILKSAFNTMSEGGAFVQFTYKFWGAPISTTVLKELDVTTKRGDGELINLPPAHVWKFTK